MKKLVEIRGPHGDERAKKTFVMGDSLGKGNLQGKRERELRHIDK